MGVVKNKCGLHGTLKTVVSKNDLVNWAGFIHADTNPGKLEVTLIIIGETSNMSTAF